MKSWILLHHLPSVQCDRPPKYLARCLGIGSIWCRRVLEEHIEKAPATLRGTCGPSLGNGKVAYVKAERCQRTDW